MHLIMVSRGPTSPFQTKDLKIGRVDNICKFVIAGLFSSHRLFQNHVTVVLYGPPRPPLSVTFTPSIKRLNPTEKEIAIALSKSLSGKPPEGVVVERKGIEHFLDRAVVMDERGKDISEFDISSARRIIIGDHLGFPDEAAEHIKGLPKVSVSPLPHTSWAVVSFLNIWLERNLNGLLKS